MNSEINFSQISLHIKLNIQLSNGAVEEWLGMDSITVGPLKVSFRLIELFSEYDF